jgi:hypothetical protein
MGNALLFGGLTIAHGVLCFIVPAYILFWAKRQETRQINALLAWGFGVLMFIIGVAVSS